MKIDRPLWAHGVVLSAQQFQQQARFESWTNQSIASRVLVHPWGIQHVAFDADALQLGKLVATRLQLCLSDSTLIDTDRLDRLPGALELSRVLPGDIQTATVVLALPLEQANGNNCLFEDGRAERPVRYRQVWRDTQDLYSDEMQSISVLEHALCIGPGCNRLIWRSKLGPQM